MFSKVIVDVPALFDREFTYAGLAPKGSLVRVPLGNTVRAGMVVDLCVTADRDEDVRPLGEPLYDGAVWLSDELMTLAVELAAFYLCPLGAVINAMLPVPFSSKEASSPRRPRRADSIDNDALMRRAPTELSAEQNEALQRIAKGMALGDTKPHLLFGVTGSGKTEVYFNAIALALSLGKQALYLVPEIALTPQVIANVRQRFGQAVSVFHSGLSPGERAQTWQQIRRGEAQVVVGARSAVFAPLEKLGLIVMDEEHEPSYRHDLGLSNQSRGFGYHTRIVAQLRARQHGAMLLMGSATPSMEVYSSALRGGTELLQLKSRPGGNSLPEVFIVDMREELRRGMRGLLSSPLRHALAQSLLAGEQALLMFNRRGYAQVSICQECGHVSTCPHCDVSLRLHVSQQALKCHYCGFAATVTGRCGRCGGVQILARGAGTEKLAEELHTLFPDQGITRLDGDTAATKGAHQKLLAQFGSQASAVLIGTRMVAKGLDFPGVTVAGVVDADSGLFYQDFRAVEESFAMLMQVAGRAGRGSALGRVFVQTYNPDHYCLRWLTQHDYEGFYRVESSMRRKLSYPPFGGLATLAFRSKDRDAAQTAATSVAELCEVNGLVILGPIPEIPAKVKDIYRFQLTLKSVNRKAIQEKLALLTGDISNLCSTVVRWYIILE